MSEPTLTEIVAKLVTAAHVNDLCDVVPASYESGLHWALMQESLTDSLIEFARDEEIGWQLNAGWRCDCNHEQACVLVCDNRLRGRSDTYELPAVTPQGALAAGLLVVLRDRAKARDIADLKATAQPAPEAQP